MIAQKAKEDYEDLLAEGLPATLEDFDRLNTLAVRLEFGPENSAVNAPRVGWAGDVPFYQPTVQSMDWYLLYADHCSADDETRNALWFFSLAHARIPGFFAMLTTPDQIERTVVKWLSRLAVTYDEMARACLYAARGLDDAQPGRNPSASQRADRHFAEKARERLHKRITRVAAALQIAPDTLLTETSSRLDALYEKVAVEQGRELKADEIADYADYKFALLEIRKRLTEEKAKAAAPEGS